MVLHFHCGGYFFILQVLFSQRKKGPRPSHFCERQRPFAARFQFSLGRSNNIRILAGHIFSVYQFYGISSGLLHCANKKLPTIAGGIA